MYLHPHRRRFFFQTLEGIAENNQVLYTTHSANFVSVPDYENIRLVYRDGEQTTRVRASTLVSTAQMKEKLRQDLDAERNELFFARHVVLVEGDTERLALPEYARRLGVNLDRAGWSIVEVGGKRSLPAFIDIVSSFGIPLTVVFDTDSSDFGSDQAEAEKTFNADLRARGDESIRVVELAPKYEKVLRAELGDELYEDLCQKYPGHSKPRRARLIAADEAAPIPGFARLVFEQLKDEDAGA
jgi:predicted ATP-dependent endonuclease of OLD family